MVVVVIVVSMQKLFSKATVKMKTVLLAYVCLIAIVMLAFIAALVADKKKEKFDPIIRSTSMWGAVISDGEKENL